jgi:short subunit dehydrogenase-like uncharacterized protein
VAGRIVLFGATGYTGRLVAAALVDRGARPVLAGRNADTLRELSDELGGGYETQTADIGEPSSVRALVEKGDVLVSTVGPFKKYGEAAVEAAIDAGAHYIDSTGEPPFIRRVFDDWGPRAQGAGSGLLTAFGYDYVPGNLAGALALEEAGELATKVAVGYFMSGGGSDLRSSMSGGTAASAAGVVLERGFAFRDGKVVGERPAKRVRSFDWSGKSLTAMSLGASEHYALPRLHPNLREVDAYLGWFGPASRPLQLLSLVGEVPGVTAMFGAVLGRVTKGSSGGPDAEARSKSGSRIVAEASDAEGNVLARVLMRGPNGYTFTGDIMAWGAQLAAQNGLEGTGALGPVDGFGLRALEAGCAEVGLTRVSEGST